MTDNTTTVEVEIDTNTTKATKKARAPRVTSPPFNVITAANGDRSIEFTNPTLLAHLRDCTNNLEGLWDKVPRIGVASLFDELPNIQSHLQENPRTPALARLVRFLETEFQAEMDRVKLMFASGVASFGALRLMLKPGTEIVIQGDHPQGGKILETEYHSSFFGDYLLVTYEYITSNGREFSTTRGEAHIGGYRGVKDITKLNVVPVDDALKAELTRRGEKYMRLGVGSHYQEFAGHMEVIKWWDYTPMRATGRMMVDIATHDQFKDSYRGGGIRGRDNTAGFKQIERDQLWMTAPYVNGFSFVTKQWGRFPVTGIQEIEFRTDAYTQLVMDPERKAMVRALVEDNNSGFSDIISGKGGGCIFLLHGEPGTGKTLTAEAVSELLHRPLYSVSVGELGTDTTTLEKSLRQILDVAQIWNAVILIDEADIFLEKRGHDIVRTAMTGIFLKLLEYHQGVMFLTTNRVKEFDTAFYSRISIALKYDQLTQTAREQIWTNLLAAAKLEGLDTHALSSIKLNGRQIKNTIRLSQSLARQEGVPVSSEHVYRCVEVGRKFAEEVG